MTACFDSSSPRRKALVSAIPPVVITVITAHSSARYGAALKRQPDLSADLIEHRHVAKRIGFAQGRRATVEDGGGEIVRLERVKLLAGIDMTRLARRGRFLSRRQIHLRRRRTRD